MGHDSNPTHNSYCQFWCHPELEHGQKLAHPTIPFGFDIQKTLGILSNCIFGSISNFCIHVYMFCTLCIYIDMAGRAHVYVYGYQRLTFV